MWEKWSEINALKNTSSERGKSNLLTELGHFFFLYYRWTGSTEQGIITEEEGWGQQITSALPFKSNFNSSWLG